MGNGFEFPLTRAQQLAVLMGPAALLVAGCGSAGFPTSPAMPTPREVDPPALTASLRHDQDPGVQVAPVDASPGDLLVSGDKTYMLLGAGKFLDYSDGRVINADQITPDLGLGGGYFKLSEAPNPQP